MGPCTAVGGGVPEYYLNRSVSRNGRVVVIFFAGFVSWTLKQPKNLGKNKTLVSVREGIRRLIVATAKSERRHPFEPFEGSTLLFFCYGASKRKWKVSFPAFLCAVKCPPPMKVTCLVLLLSGGGASGFFSPRKFRATASRESSLEGAGSSSFSGRQRHAGEALRYGRAHEDNLGPLLNAALKRDTNPLLTHSEEIELSTLVQRMLAVEKTRVTVASELGRDPTKEEWAIAAGLGSVKEIGQSIRQGRWAKQELMRKNLRLVLSIARRHKGRGAPLGELVQVGRLFFWRGKRGGKCCPPF